MKLDNRVLELCIHEDVEIIPPCCTFISPNGLIECGCGGRSELMCNNVDCQGIEDYEVDDIFEKLVGGGSDCE